MAKQIKELDPRLRRLVRSAGDDRRAVRLRGVASCARPAALAAALLLVLGLRLRA